VWRQVLELDPRTSTPPRPPPTLWRRCTSRRVTTAVWSTSCAPKGEWTGDRRERTALLLRIAALEEKSLGDLAGRGGHLQESARDRRREPGSAHPARADLRIHGTAPRARRHSVAPGGVGDATTRRELRFRIAAILERELGDIDEAISAVTAILDETDDDRGALEALGRLYQKKGATAERLEDPRAPARSGLQHRRSGRALASDRGTLQGPLGRPGEAFDRWREILQLAPRDPGALAQLERLLTEDDGAAGTLRAPAAQALEPLYESLGEWGQAGPGPGHLHRGRRRSSRAHAPPGAAGALEDRRLGNKPAAFVSLRRRHPRRPEQPGAARPARFRTKRLSTEIGPQRIDEVAGSLPRGRARRARRAGARAVASGPSPSTPRSAATAKLASTYYAKILDRTPDDAGVLAALEGLHRKAGDLPSLYEVLLRRSDSGQRPQVRRACPCGCRSEHWPSSSVAPTRP